MVELNEYGFPDGFMYNQYRYLTVTYPKYFFSYGSFQPQDGGCLIFVLESNLERYPLAIRNFILYYSEYEIYTLYEVRKCDYCDNYILLYNINYYNIDNKYVCLECFADGTYKEYMYDNINTIVDHIDDIAPYNTGSNTLGRNKCVR